MIQTITRDQLMTALDEGREVMLVEFLSPQSYEKGHLPGAINVPRERVRELAPLLLPDKDAEIVVYCANAECQS